MPFKKGNKLFLGRHHSKEARKKISNAQKGEKNSVWNGGRTISGGGYVSLLYKDHPYADVNGRVKEERIIMEDYLGRYLLPTEIVHHKNRKKQDNRIKNLQVVNSKEHAFFHIDRRKGKKASDETKLKMSIFQKNRKRTSLSEETKQKISKSNTGKIRSKEFKENISKYMKGRKDSLETRIKKSNSIKLSWIKRKENI